MGIKKKRESMHMFVMLALVVILTAVLTYVIPAGSYTRVQDEATGRNVIDVTSYEVIESTPVTPIQLISSIEKGFEEAAGIIALALVSAGMLGVIQEAGLIKAMVQGVTRKFSKKGLLAVCVLFCVMAGIDTVIGMPELTVMYISIILPIIIALGYDTLTALAVVVSGNCVGFTSGLLNPYTTIVAQKLTGLPILSGLWFRAIMMVVYCAISLVYICIRANRVKKDPTKSLTYELDEKYRQKYTSESEMADVVKLTVRQKIAAIFAVLVFIFMVFGIIKWGWDLAEMAGMMIVIAFGTAAIAGISINTACNVFTKGAGEVLSAALLISIARAISVVMTEGQIVDTIVHAASIVIGGMPAGLLAVGIFILATLINFFIPSGSGEAVVIVPILSPLADVLGINQQTMVIGFQLGDGFSNTIFPTNGSYLAAIQVAGVRFTTWLRYQLPLFAMWFVAGCATLIIAQAINLGPF